MIQRAILISLSLAAICLGNVAAAEAAEEQIVRLARNYLASDDAGERRLLAATLDAYGGPTEPVLQALAARTYSAVEPGYLADEKFANSEYRERYPDDWLYFVVPKTYDPRLPTGLIVFMHGGGIGTVRDAAKYTLQFPLSDSPADTYRSGDMLDATDMITVGPSAPEKYVSYYRWCLRSSEEYLATVIAECKERFNIDPDRVFLLGHSMGGFGAFHHALRQPDRFAGIISCAGAWDCGYWPVVRGTPLCIISARHDAEKDARWHYTDVEYGRLTHHLLTRAAIDHVYYEYEGGHNFGGMRPFVAQYLQERRTLRRDPYYPHVAVATPQGFTWTYLNRVRHNRWLTLDETTDGTIAFDALDESGDDFDSWSLEHTLRSRRGAAVDAVVKRLNHIEATTQNVARFTVWLHPRMVDVSQPVTIVVDGKVRFSDRVKPSLSTALDSYERRRDWGLIYPIRVAIDLRE